MTSVRRAPYVKTGFIVYIYLCVKNMVFIEMGHTGWSLRMYHSIHLAAQLGSILFFKLTLFSLQHP